LSAGIVFKAANNKVRRTTISGVYNGINIGEAIEGTVTGLVTHDNLFEENRIETDPTGQTAVGMVTLQQVSFQGLECKVVGLADTMLLPVMEDQPSKFCTQAIPAIESTTTTLA
jgi:hypothetical protein